MISNHLPDTSRVWIYPCDRFFNEEESKIVKEDLNNFLSSWEAHGKKLAADGELVDNKFLILMADENAAHVTGCSIDSSVAFVKSLEQKFGVNFFDRTQVNYLENGEIAQCHLNDFWARRKALVVTEDTIVFDNLVKNKGQFNSSWKVPFKDSWHQEMWR